MRYFTLGERVLANCNTLRAPDWVPGVVIELTGSQYKPYRVRLDKKSDGLREWYFSSAYLKRDTPRNRGRSGLPPAR